MTQAEEQLQGGNLLASISNSMVRAMREYYGKGPTKAKTYMVDDYVICAMQDGLTTVEKTLLRAGKVDLVREVRQTFQNEMAAEFTGKIAELTGRRVLTYQSQILFDPDVSFEIFVLEPGNGGGAEATAEAQIDLDQPIGEGAAVGEATEAGDPE